jgi:hypothetical protein
VIPCFQKRRIFLSLPWTFLFQKILNFLKLIEFAHQSKGHPVIKQNIILLFKALPKKMLDTLSFTDFVKKENTKNRNFIFKEVRNIIFLKQTIIS